MWTPWKVSTFLAWEEDDYSLKTLAPLSKASGSNPANAIPGALDYLPPLIEAKWMVEIVQKKRAKKIEGKEKGLKKRNERN